MSCCYRQHIEWTCRQALSGLSYGHCQHPDREGNSHERGGCHVEDRDFFSYDLSDLRRAVYSAR